jgi:hypothetical protein
MAEIDIELYSGTMHADMPFARYLNEAGYGSSDHRTIREQPPAVLDWKRKNRDAGSRFAGIGKATHCRILTPDLFAKEFYCKKPGEEFRTKEAKLKRDGLLEQGVTILSQDDAAITQQAVDAVKALPAAQNSIDKAIGKEISCFWRCPVTGIPLKCRPDFWFEHGSFGKMVVDIKVTIEATKPIDRILLACNWNGWINQLAHNRGGLRACGQDVRRGGLLLVPNSAPYRERVRLLTWSSDALDEVESMNIDSRKKIAACHDTGKWPIANVQWEEQELPRNFIWEENDEAQLEGAEEATI